MSHQILQNLLVQLDASYHFTVMIAVLLLLDSHGFISPVFFHVQILISMANLQAEAAHQFENQNTKLTLEIRIPSRFT